MIRGLIIIVLSTLLKQIFIKFIIYLLTYSCYHTIANKLNCKITEVIKRFGKSLKVQWLEKVEVQRKVLGKEENNDKIKEIKLIDWDDSKKLIDQAIFRKIKKTQDPTLGYYFNS